MFIAALVSLLALVHPVVCQSVTAGGKLYDGDGSDFQPDSLTIVRFTNSDKAHYSLTLQNV